MQNYKKPKLEPLLSMIYLVFTDHACAQREFVTVFVFVHFCLCICVCVFLFVYCCLQWFMRRRRFRRPSACSSSGSENIQSDWSDLLTGARNERFSENNQSQLHQKSRIKLELSPFFFFRNWFLPCPAKMHLQAFVSLPQPCRSAARQLCHQFCSTIIAKPISAPDSDQRLWLTNALRLFKPKNTFITVESEPVGPGPYSYSYQMINSIYFLATRSPASKSALSQRWPVEAITWCDLFSTKRCLLPINMIALIKSVTGGFDQESGIFPTSFSCLQTHQRREALYHIFWK